MKVIITHLLNLNLKDLLKEAPFDDVQGNLFSIDGDISLEYPELYIELALTDSLLIKGIIIQNTFKTYELPEGLEFSNSKEMVNAVFGEPHKHCDERQSSLLGRVSAYDMYYLKSYSMHISYDTNLKSIDKITLMTPEATPGREG